MRKSNRGILTTEMECCIFATSDVKNEGSSRNTRTPPLNRIVSWLRREEQEREISNNLFFYLRLFHKAESNLSYLGESAMSLFISINTEPLKMYRFVKNSLFSNAFRV